MTPLDFAFLALVCVLVFIGFVAALSLNDD